MSAGQFDLHAWLKAEAHLAEGRVQSADVTPLSIVHAAYYAMFHAARAVLLRTTGSAPKKHGSVIGQFGFLVKDRGIALKQAGDDLNKIEARRIDADYEEGIPVSSADARDSMRKAEDFLDLCSREFGFERSPSPSDG